MEAKIKKILEKKDQHIKSFGKLPLTENDLRFISRELENHSNICFIDWEQNENVLNKNKDLKKDIQKRLVSNLLGNKDNRLVINLSNYALDDDFLELLAIGIKNNFSIGGIIWGEQNERKFKTKTNQLMPKIEKHLSKNNVNYKRFPSDYIHCVMANHCRSGDTKMRKILEGDGWSIRLELKDKRYASILYENKSQRQLVLAFRGIKFEIRHIFAEEKCQAFDEVSYQTCNAYQHMRAAYELSRDLNYNLSFTGYSLGAWLAEQSVYFCYREFGTLNVRAVTFESPGSYEILEELDQFNSERHNLGAKDLEKLLDVRTYLSSPNFINTCNRHIGKVYRLYESSTSQKRIQIIDDYIADVLLKSINGENMRVQLTEWYTNIVRKKLSKYTFYLNGLRSLLSDDIGWILNEFDPMSRIFKCKVREVVNWPLMRFTFRLKNSENLDILKKLNNVIPFGEASNILKKPFDWTISSSIKSITKKYQSGVALVINLISEIKTGNLNTSQCLKCFEYEENIFEHPDKSFPIYDGDFELKYNGKYRVRKFDPLYDQLNENQSHIDHKIVEFYYSIDEIYSSLSAQLNDLKRYFEISIKWNGKTYVGDIKSIEIDVDVIRERFIRLFEINEIYKQRFRRVSDIGDYFDDAPLDVFVKTDNSIFCDIDRILENNKYVYIYGESGFGKTTLARMYAYYRKKNQEILVMYIDSDSSLSSNLIDIISKLNGEINRDQVIKKDDDLIHLVEERLNSIGKSILFIFDNVKNLKDVEKILNKLANHKFIITTENENLFKDYDLEKKLGVQIKPFDEKNCLQYLKLKGIDVKSKKEKESWLDLIKEITKGSMKISPRIFEFAIQNHLNSCSEKEDIRDYLIEGSHQKYKILEKENNKSYTILAHLAYLDGKYIDEHLIRKMFLEELSIDKYLKLLLNRGYLKKSKLNKKIYLMHEKDQCEFKDVIEIQNKKEKILKRILYVLNSSLSNDINELKRVNKDRLKIYIKHIKHVLKERWVNKDNEKSLLDILTKTALINDKIIIDHENVIRIENEILKILPSNSPYIGSSYKNIGNVYFCQGDLEKALDYHQKSLETSLQVLSPNHPDIAASCNNLGKIYDSQSDFEKALYYYLKSLKIKKEILSSNHPDIAASYTNIGYVHYIKGNLDKALDFYMKSYDILKKTLPLNHAEIDAACNDIGMIYYDKGNFEKSYYYYMKSLEIKIKALPSLNHPDIATSCSNIGMIFSKQGKLDKALNYHMKSLEIKERILPRNLFDIDTSYNNIGLVYFDQGNFEKALEYCMKSAKIREKTLPGDHPCLFSSYNTIGNIYYKQNNLTKALAYYRASNVVNQKAMKSNTLKMAAFYANIGNVYCNSINLEMGLFYHKKSLEIRQKSLSPNHPDIAASYNNIGLAYYLCSNFKIALAYFMKSLEIWQKVMPLNNAAIAASYTNVGNIYYQLGDLAKALECCIKSLENHQKALLPNQHDISLSYNSIGQIYFDQGDFEKALEYMLKSLEIRQKSLPSDHPDLAASYRNIGLVYFGHGNFEKALDNYMKSLEIHQKVQPLNHHNIALVYDNIGMVFCEQDSFEKALEYHLKSLEIRKKDVLPSSLLYTSATCYYISLAYKYQGNSDKALEYYLKGCEISDLDDGILLPKR